jgi:hypothetical protein
MLAGMLAKLVSGICRNFARVSSHEKNIDGAIPCPATKSILYSNLGGVQMIGWVAATPAAPLQHPLQLGCSPAMRPGYFEQLQCATPEPQAA